MENVTRHSRSSKNVHGSYPARYPFTKYLCTHGRYAVQRTSTVPISLPGDAPPCNIQIFGYKITLIFTQ